MTKANDLEKLQGTWTITTLEMDGQRMPAGMLGEATITIAGARFTTTGMGAAYGGRVEVDANASPRQIDLVFTSGPPAGMTNPAIYELDGDTMRLCISTRGARRPKTFAAPAGSGYALETLVRAGVKTAGKKAGTKSSAKAKTSASQARASEIEGEWLMVSGIVDGVAMPESMVRFVKRVNEGNVTTVTAGPQTMLKAEFMLDGAAKPKAIDYRHLHGNHEGKTQRGIYALKGRELTVLMGAPGGTRPAAFAAKPPKGGTLTVWKRV
jgi:uncharacterized protein (TIGR03067 family)